MKYIATFVFAQRFRAEAPIHARTLAEAEEKAAAMSPCRVSGWEPSEPTMTVETVCEASNCPPREERIMWPRSL